MAKWLAASLDVLQMWKRLNGRGQIAGVKGVDAFIFAAWGSSVRCRENPAQIALTH
jgi:hypothetical protein